MVFCFLDLWGSVTWLVQISPTTAAAAKSLQSCPTLCDPRDGSPPGSPVPGILQARTLDWVAISFSNAWKWKVKVKSLSSVRLLATPWTAAYQAPLSMGFSRQEYWSGVPLPSPISSIDYNKYPNFKVSKHMAICILFLNASESIQMLLLWALWHLSQPDQRSLLKQWHIFHSPFHSPVEMTSIDIFQSNVPHSIHCFDN